METGGGPPQPNSSSNSNDGATIKKLNELNSIHAFVMVGGAARIQNETHDPIDGRLVRTYSSIGDFKKRYENVPVDDPKQTKSKPKQISLGEAWIKWPKRRTYDGIVYQPKVETPNFYNLWQGFAYVPSEKGTCERFLKHWHEIICAGDDDLFVYCVAWMAQCVQDPCNKPGTALVLRGAQGTGKTLAASLFGEIFGAHFLKLSKKEHLLGRFNQHLHGVSVLLLEEVSWSKNKVAEGILKDLVTSETLQIEAKFGDVTVTPNLVHLLITSNEDWVIPAGKEERRFCVIDVSQSKRGDIPYFEEIIEEMNNGGFEALLYLLENHDYSDVDLRIIPKTDALNEQKFHSMSPFDKFWFERLGDGVLTPGTDADWPNSIGCQSLRDIYAAEVAQAGQIGKGWETEFGTRLAKLFPGLVKAKKLVEGKSKNFYVLPPLEECRKLFTDATGFEFEADLTLPDHL